MQVRGNITYYKGRQEQLSRIRVFKTSSAGVKGATPPNHSVDFPNMQWLYKKNISHNDNTTATNKSNNKSNNNNNNNNNNNSYCMKKWWWKE